MLLTSICKILIDKSFTKLEDYNIISKGGNGKSVIYKYFIIENLKKNNSYNLFNTEYIKYNIYHDQEINVYNGKINDNFSYLLIYDKLYCLATTNLFRNNTVNKNNINIWKNINNENEDI